MTSSRPEPMTVQGILFNCSEGCDIEDAMYCEKCVGKAIDSARAEALEKFKSPTTKLLLDNAYAQGYAQGAKENKTDDSYFERIKKKAYAQGCVDTLHNSPMYEEGWNDCRERAIKVADEIQQKHTKDHVDYRIANVDLNCGGMFASRKIVEQLRALTPSEGGTK